MLKSVYDPHRKITFKLGRRAPRIPHLKFKARHILNLPALAVPDTTKFRARALTSLRRLYGNDELGDCVPAWLAHFLGLETAAAGAPFICTDDQVVKMYEAIGDYVPGDPTTDNGCDEDTAINYVETHGLPNGTKVLGAIEVDVTNPKEIHACQWLFGNTMFGVGMPDAWISPFPAGDGVVWDVAGSAVPQNGHCFGGVDNDPRGLIIDTWGLFLTITFEAIAKYASVKSGGQLFALLTPDQLAKGVTKAPNGVDWPTIVAAFNARGGNVRLPALPPAPIPLAPPTPVPPVPTNPTLAKAKMAVGDALRAARGPQAIQRDAAIKTACAALEALPGWSK